MPEPLNRPNFFIVGAQKAGTTSLYNYLAQHPQIYMSPVKEPSYFAPEQCPAGSVPSWAAYLRHFAEVTDELAIGEATATYLWSETAARNIATRIPDAKIIISLRNPIERAFSQYLHMLTQGATRNSFREQINMGLQCRNTPFSVLWPFLELGKYHEQIIRYFREFPRSQIHISYYDELEQMPAQVMRDLYSFLGVDANFVTDVTYRHNQPRIPRLTTTAYFLKRWGAWRYLRRLAPRSLGPRMRSVMLRSRESLRIERADRAFLAAYYREDVIQLSLLLDRDLTVWLDTDRH
jgi:hypothetical protein